MKVVSSIIRLALASVCGIVAIFFLYWQTTPEARYQELPEHYEMIYKHTGPVDIIIHGSSEPRTALGAQEITRMLGPIEGRPAVVYNMCRSWRGFEPDYVVLRDYLQRRPAPKVIVISMQPGAHNGMFRRLSTYSDAWEDAAAYPQWHWWQQLHFFLSENVQRTIVQSIHYLTRRVKKLEQLPVVAAESAEQAGPHAGVKLYALEDSLRIYRKSAQRLQWEPTGSHSTYYLQKIIDLAHEHGSAVLLIYIPTLTRPPYDQQSAQALEEFFQMKFHQLDTPYLERYLPRGVSDGYHATQYGRDIASEWLAGILREKLGLAAPESAAAPVQSPVQ